MSCPVTLKSIGLTCADAMGGIKRIYVALQSDVSSMTVEDGVVTAITMANGKKFTTFEFRKQTGAYTSTVANDDAAGTSSVTTELTLQFSKADNVKRMAIQALINANAVVIVETQLRDAEGADGSEGSEYMQYILLGVDNPVTCTAGTMVSGTAVGDLNGFTLTLQDLSRELPPFVGSTVVNGVIA